MSRKQSWYNHFQYSWTILKSLHTLSQISSTGVHKNVVIYASCSRSTKLNFLARRQLEIRSNLLAQKKSSSTLNLFITRGHGWKICCCGTVFLRPYIRKCCIFAIKFDNTRINTSSCVRKFEICIFRFASSILCILSEKQMMMTSKNTACLMALENRALFLNKEPYALPRSAWKHQGQNGWNICSHVRWTFHLEQHHKCEPHFLTCHLLRQMKFLLKKWTILVHQCQAQGKQKWNPKLRQAQNARPHNILKYMYPASMVQVLDATSMGTILNYFYLRPTFSKASEQLLRNRLIHLPEGWSASLKCGQAIQARSGDNMAPWTIWESWSSKTHGTSVPDQANVVVLQTREAYCLPFGVWFC